MIRANPPMRRARLLAHDRDIEFEQDIGPGERRRDDAGRHRPDIAEMLADHRIDGRTVGTIANEDRDLADVLERSISLRENSREVGHRKVGLRPGVGATSALCFYTRVVEVRAGLPADEELIVSRKDHRALPWKPLTVPVVERVGRV